MRSKIFKSEPRFALSADLHIREDFPICRTDDYIKTQTKKLTFIADLCRSYDIPLIVAGDFGNHYEWSNWLITLTYKIFKGVQVIIVPGQHDLPYHNLKMLDKSALGVFSGYKNFIVLKRESIFYEQYINSFPYGSKIIAAVNRHTYLRYKPILVTHSMVIKDEKQWPGQQAHRARWWLKKYPSYDLIVIGDNHMPFVEKYGGRLLVNPGCMMRMETEMEFHRPRVYLWHERENDVETIYLPIEEGVISRKHLRRKEKGKEYADRMKGKQRRTLSFKDNVEKHLEENPQTTRVEKKTWKLVGGKKRRRIL